MSSKANAQVDDYLDYLSNRLRGLRAARGMTRSLLSDHSSISERYLAQLENGKANPSVAVLWRIASALDVDLRYLLTDEAALPGLRQDIVELVQSFTDEERLNALRLLHAKFRSSQRSKRGIGLIGLRGAGKTTIGSLAAEMLSVPFIRLTEEIAENAGIAIKEVFSLGGQKTYRRLEREAVEQLLKLREPFIVELGGSIVTEPSTFNLVAAGLVTVWLQAQPEEHMSRVIGQGDTRPMEEASEEAMSDLRRILMEREGEYRKADHIINTSSRDAVDCANELQRIAVQELNFEREPVR